MSLIRPVGYETLECGCRLGRYLSVDTGDPVAYLEVKSLHCTSRRHRPNHPVSSTSSSLTFLRAAAPTGTAHAR